MDHQHLLQELQNIHRMNDQLQAFCECPNDLKFKKVQPDQRMLEIYLLKKPTYLARHMHNSIRSFMRLLELPIGVTLMQEPISQTTSERLLGVTA